MKYDEICKNSAGPLTYMLRNVEATAPLMPYGFHEQIILTPAFMKSHHTISHISRYHRLRVVVGQGFLDSIDEEEMIFDIEQAFIHPRWE